MAPWSNSCSEAIWAASFSFPAHEDSPPGGKLLFSMLSGTRRDILQLRGQEDLIKWTDWGTLASAERIAKKYRFTCTMRLPPSLYPVFGLVQMIVEPQLLIRTLGEQAHIVLENSVFAYCVLHGTHVHIRCRSRGPRSTRSNILVV